MPPAEPSPGSHHALVRHIAATRPAFLLTALVAVTLGVAAAGAAGQSPHWMLVLGTMLAALSLHAAVNVLNDYYDALGGGDAINTERIYPYTGGSRVIQNGVFSDRAMARFGVGLLLATTALGVVLSWWAGPRLLWLGLLGVLLGWGYSAPPLQLNARGLGELTVAAGFGVLIPLGSYWVQSGDSGWLAVAAGTPYGLMVANILLINQFPDATADAACGKRHWVVRLGRQRARWGYPLLAGLSALSLLGLVNAGVLPAMALWALLATLPAVPASVALLRYANTPERLVTAIRLTIAAALCQGVIVALALSGS